LPTDPKVIGRAVPGMRGSAMLFFLMVVLQSFMFIGVEVQVYLEQLLTGWL
jgi:hypothetical protein